MQKNTLFIDEKKILKCSLHNNNEINWICLENSCESRLLCSFCVIKNHSSLHKNFIGLQTLIKDPISTFSNLVINENEIIPGKTITEKIEKLIQKQEQKLDDLCNNLLTSFAFKINDIKMKFHDDLVRFMKKNELHLNELEKSRKDYEEFCKSHFQTKNINNLNYIKDGIDEILNKYFSDFELQSKFYYTIKSIPLINDQESYDVHVNHIKIDDLKWRNFCDRDLGISIYIYIEYKYIIFIGFWTFDKNICPADFVFTDNYLCVEKVGTDYPLTLLGNFEFVEGYYSWSILIEGFKGKYLCLGIIPTISAAYLNYRSENYSKACCVCTDSYYYNLEIDSGFLMINEGDTIDFVLDYEKDVFLVKSDQFIFKKEGIKNFKFYPYFGFSKNCHTKLKIIK